MPNNRLYILFQQWCSREIREEDINELMELLYAADKNNTLSEAMRNMYNQLKIEPFFSEKEKKKIVDNSLKKVDNRNKIVLLRKLAAAAMLLLFLGISTYFIFLRRTKTQSVASIHLSTQDDVMAPSKNKAILTLGNGSVIALDSAGNGTLAVQGNMKIAKTSGNKIVCNGNSSKITYNTLTVPRGSNPMQLQLADGSKVWLNVASSITFPSSFKGNIRKITMTGEAYFEIAHDVLHPFVVSNGSNEVRVLGTHFNVNAYSDEPALKVTLIKGLVEVDHSLVITPGQQAVVVNNKPTLNTHPNLNEVMAWKNEEFIFNSFDVSTILRELSKWYDVDIEYKSTIPKGHYSGIISRSNKLSQVLQILEAGGIEFQITKKKLIVL